MHLRHALTLLLLCLPAFALGQASSPTLALDDSPTSPAARALLDRIEQRYGKLQTLTAKFDQLRSQEIFDERIASRGQLWIARPDRLRCDYFEPEPSTLLFAGDTLYQYTPSILQVDKFVYDSPERARQQLRLMMLSFGLSSGEVLDNYRVTPAKPDPEAPENAPGLRFEPRRPEIADIYREILVWFHPATLLPEQVRFEETSGDTTRLTIREISVDDSLEMERFEPDFPEDAEVIEHQG